NDLLHHSPRLLGKPTSLWTLDLVAEVCCAKGWTPRQLTGEAIRVALKRLGIRWRRAKHWITSPDPAYARKKSPRPLDPPGRGPPRRGGGVPGGARGERAGAAGAARLGRGRATAAGRAGRRPHRPRPQGAVLLRPVARRHGRDAAALRPGPSGEPSHGGLP